MTRILWILALTVMVSACAGGSGGGSDAGSPATSPKSLFSEWRSPNGVLFNLSSQGFGVVAAPADLGYIDFGDMETDWRTTVFHATYTTLYGGSDLTAWCFYDTVTLTGDENNAVFTLSQVGMPVHGNVCANAQFSLTKAATTLTVCNQAGDCTILR